MLRDEDWEQRKEAPRLLRDLKTPEAFAALKQASDDEDMEVRVAIAEALAGFDKDDSEPLLFRFLKDPDWEVQWAAMRALSSQWQEPALRKMGDPSIEKRIPGIESIGRKKDDRFVPLLLAALDQETDVQRVAILALAPFYDPEILQEMKRIAPDADDEIKAMLQEYLEMRGASLPGGEDARLCCEESGIKLPYSKLFHAGSRKTPPQWLAKPHFEELQARLEPFEGKLRVCKQCKIYWPRYDCVEGYCPSCRAQRYEELPLPDDGFFRCFHTHKIRTLRDRSPVQEDAQPLSHRGAYQIATQSPSSPFISHRALLFLKKAYQEGYLLCERSHQFLPREQFPDNAHFLDPCQSHETTRSS